MLHSSFLFVRIFISLIISKQGPHCTTTIVILVVCTRYDTTSSITGSTVDANTPRKVIIIHSNIMMSNDLDYCDDLGLILLMYLVPGKSIF